MKKKFIIIILTVITIFCLNATSLALTNLYEKVTEEKISSGVTLKNYNHFTEKGWLNINILEVNLDDTNTSVGLLTSENGLNTFQTVLEMAKNNSSIAAINGDFFSGKSTNGYTVGLSISDGELLTSTYIGNEKKDEFASFILNEDTSSFIDYFNNVITLKSRKNDTTLLIKEYNRLSTNYDTIPVIYTSAWGDKSIGSFSYLDITEMLVVNNTVKKIVCGEEGLEIPENGFVISTCGANAELLKNNFKVGDKITLDIDLGINIEKVKLAVSGGAILVKDGTIPKFSANISGTHPRTAIGISKDSKTLYLVTIDGRQKTSIGMTQTELAEFLIEKNIYTALNLDGGGSTTMVAQKLGEKYLSVINSPSDGTLRKVTNALGIFNTSKTSSLSNLIIEVSEENVFVNCERELKVKGYDKYYNPIEIDLEDITWTISGVDGKIENGKLIAGNEAGTINITAQKGKIKTTISIDILSAPNEITIEPKISHVEKNEKVKLNITAKNKNGYYASIKNSELSWKIISGDGEFLDGIYTPKKDGIHLIEVSKGFAKSYAIVEVMESKEIKIDYISNDNFKFISYPKEVTGEITKTDSNFVNLSYDFSKTDVTRAAYLRFKEPIILKENYINLSFDVITNETISDYIKIKIVDNTGSDKLIMVQRGFDASNNKLTLNIPLNNISLPAKLTDIYIGQDTKDILSKGNIKIGNLTITEKGTSKENLKLPKDIKGIDSANVQSNNSGDNTIKIALYDKIDKPVILLDKLKNAKLESTLNKNADLIILTNQVSNNEISGITKPIIKTSAYSKSSYETIDIITIDVTNGGLRNTNYTQWLNFQNDIKNSKNKNILILMKGSLDNFTDKNERTLFIDVMCELKRNTSKNIWILNEGNYTDYSMERGIRYLSVNNENFNLSEPIEVAEKTSYILITIDGNNMTYEIKNLF